MKTTQVKTAHGTFAIFRETDDGVVVKTKSGTQLVTGFTY